MKKKNQIFLALLILCVGLCAKGMSLITKIIMTREVGLESISIFSLVNPLILLLLTLSSLSLPNAIGSIISKKPEKRKQILITALIICSIISISLMILLLFFSNFIASNLLHNSDTIPCILASIFVIPLTSFSSIIKGYFLGIGEIKLTSFSQIFEECGRFLFLIIILFFFPNLDYGLRASICVFSLCVGEVFQIIYLLLFYKNFKLKKISNIFQKITKNDLYFTDILKISLPLTLSRLIGSLTYFIEPIIFTSLMLKNNVTIEETTIIYGTLNQYVMPLLLMPGFISVSLSNLLIPNMGRYIRNNNIKKAKNYFYKICLSCLIIGTFISLVYFIFSEQIVSIVYGSNIGSDLVKQLSFCFIIYYIETPIITCMSIFNLSFDSFKSTLISSICRIIIMVLLIEKYQIYGLAFATIVSTYIDVLLNIIFLIRFFFRKKKETICKQQ